MIRQGDIVEIPLPDGRSALGWIVLVSQRFKDCVGFVILGVDGRFLSSEIQLNGHICMLGPYYTHIMNLNDLKCRILDHVPPSDRQKEVITTRLVGGGIYVGDEFTRPAESRELGRLRKMLTLGMSSIVGEVNQVFPVSQEDELGNQAADSFDTDFVTLALTTDDDQFIEALTRLRQATK
jgi:hypothetical protein